MIAIYPGSFDPPTVGHLEIMRRASLISGKLYVLVLVNPGKTYRFTLAERVSMLQKIAEDMPSVKVMASDRPLIELYNELGAGCIVRGLRSGQDYANERPVADAFLELTGAETIFIQSSPSLSYISSSLVREMLSLGLSVNDLVPSDILVEVSSEGS